MPTFVLVLALAAIAAAVGSKLQIRYAAAKLISQNKNARLFPKGLAMLLIVGHLSELLHAVQHASIVHLAVALFLLVGWKISTTESEGELF